MEGRKWQKGRIITHFYTIASSLHKSRHFPRPAAVFTQKTTFRSPAGERKAVTQSFLKNATATTPGPVCVPITLQMSVESSISTLPCQMSRLSSTYFLR